jgi:effector-binding domain-containing protein
MAIAITVRNVKARRLAAVRRDVALGAVGQAWKPALDLVWKFLRQRSGLHQGGHNVFLYHHPARRDLPMAVDFGVEITRDFEAEGEIRPVLTPEGEAAIAIHVGDYAGMRTTHEAIHAWARDQGRSFAGTSMEIYGDWTNDPAKLETEIVYLLA